MAKAVRIHAHGGPEALIYEDVPTGQPKAGEVILRQHAIGVNFIDVYFRTGLYPAPTMPLTIGHEGAGEIIAVGEGVTEFAKGDRVAYCSRIGSYAEERVIDANAL